jgi:peptidoglycan-N-acetylglucosamine deacetylase
MSSRNSPRHVAATAYLAARASARRLGLGRLRIRVRAKLHASPLWTAVPPQRLKDLDLASALPGNAIALTFDDGPDSHVTPRLLGLLESHSAHATFFMCGLAAQRHPDLVRAVVAGGHAIGGHTWDHRQRMVRGISEAEWRRQVDDTHALLADLSGAPVRWFRPPRGITDRFTYERLRQQGVTTVLWSVDGRDCTLREPAEIAAGVLGELRPRDITLLHDANANFLFSPARPRTGELGNQESTVLATETILRAARERSLIPVSLDALPEKIGPRSGRPRLTRSLGGGS